jgi:hypothetical protein
MGLLPLAPEASASASSATSAVEIFPTGNRHYTLPSRRAGLPLAHYNRSMHLSVARLCLDCQEIHDDDRCPVCTSEAFGFITRWVKVEAPPHRVSPNQAHAVDSARVDSYRQILNPGPRRSTAGKWLRKGGLVVAAGYLARLGWQIAAQRHRANGSSPKDT